MILDLIMMEGRVPPELLRARITMLQKVQEVQGPGDYRSIAVGSVIVRHLCRTAHMEAVVSHVQEQSYFRRGFDGATMCCLL